MKRWAHTSLLALTAAVGLGCSGPESARNDEAGLAHAQQAVVTQWQVVVPGGATLMNTILSATSSLKVDDRVTVGDGTKLYAIASFGTQTTQLAAGVKANGNVSSVANVFMGSSSNVKGFVKTTGTVQAQAGATISGGKTTNVAIAQTPTSWSVDIPNTNGGDVYLPPDGSLSLAPGAYAALSAQSRSTLALRTGTYYFSSFNTEPQTKVQLDESAGPVVIYVTGSLTAKGDWIPSGGTGTNLLIVYLGTGIADFFTAIAGAIVAPNGTVNLERPSNNAIHKGSVFAKNIEVFSDTKLYYGAFDWNGFFCPKGDTDGDGITDCQDKCPRDPNKSDPGVCGCGVAEQDTDGDGVPNCKEPACQNDASRTRAGICGGCGKPFAPAGTKCTDGTCAGHFTCDGAGNCGSAATCSPDPGNCVAKDLGDRLYWVCQGSVTWNQALALCSATPGQSLVKIDSRAENALVSKWVGGAAWTGANDASVLGAWRWSKGGSTDGNLFYANGNVLTGSYANWASSKPGDNAGRCATLQNGGTWSDQPCTQTVSTYICEIPGPTNRLDGPTSDKITCDQFSPNKTCSDTVPNVGPCVPKDTALPATIEEFNSQLQACEAAGCTQDGDPGCSQCAGAAAVPPPDSTSCTVFGNQPCAIQPVQPLVPCLANSDCASGQVCEYDVTCKACDQRDAAGNCVRVCPPAQRVCGIRDEGCAQATDDDGITRCDQTEICADPTADGNNDYLADPGSELTEQPFDEGVFGTPTTPIGTYPIDPACSSPPCSPQSMNHPWCSYVVDDTLEAKNPNADSKHGRGGSGSLVQFDFDPNLNLTFDVSPKALGEMDYNLEAIGSLATGVTFNLPIVGSTSVPILDAEASFKAHRCRIWTTDSHFSLFGTDFLPEIAPNMLFSVGSDDPNDVTNGACAKAISDYQIAVSRAKKALKDAQELLRQYNTAKAAGNKLQAHLCTAILDDPPAGFPAGDCPNESPEATINRFITYYENQVTGALSQQLNLNNMLPTAPTASLQFASAGGSETMPIINAQFFVGPIPMNLEVEAVVNYGITGSMDFQVNPSSLLATGARERLARVGGTAAPNANAAVSLFVGAGFSALGFSAKAGVEGAINLGYVSAPVTAGAGIDVQAEKDVRPLPEDLATLASSSPLVDPQQYHFYLGYDFGVQATLSEVLSGYLAAKVRIKIAFFHKSWSKRLVTFGSPLPSKTLNLVSDGSSNAATGLADWGVVQMPTPFVGLLRLEVPTTSTGTAPFDANLVEKLFYDRLCTCQPLGQACNTNGDCCPSTTGGENPVCFGYLSEPKFCSNCRPAGETCNPDGDDCCSVPGQTMICKMNDSVLVPYNYGKYTCQAQVQIF